MIRFRTRTNNISRAGLIRRAAATTFAAASSTLFAGVALAAGGEKSDEEILKETLFQGVNLILLLGVLFYVARKPVAEYFATRRSDIRAELDEAASLLTQAEQRNAELQRRLVDLSSEITEIQETATQRADTEAEQILADARATAERIRRDASAAVDQELRRAQAALREEAADLAVEIATRKLQDQVSDGDRERLVDEFIMHVEPASGRTGGGAKQ